MATKIPQIFYSFGQVELVKRYLLMVYIIVFFPDSFSCIKNFSWISLH